MNESSRNQDILKEIQATQTRSTALRREKTTPKEKETMETLTKQPVSQAVITKTEKRKTTGKTEGAGPKPIKSINPIHEEMAAYAAHRQQLCAHFEAIWIKEELSALTELVEQLALIEAQPAPLLKSAYDDVIKASTTQVERDYLDYESFCSMLQTLPAMVLEAQWPLKDGGEMLKYRRCQFKLVDKAYRESLNRLLPGYHQIHRQYVQAILNEREARQMTSLQLPTYPKVGLKYRKRIALY